MIIFLLLIFSLGSAKGQAACQGGWINCTCETLDIKVLPKDRMRIFQNKSDVVTVVVKNMTIHDKIYCRRNKEEEKKGREENKRIEIVNCLRPQSNHTAYNKAQTTVECGRPDSTNKFGHVYLCKETGDFECEDVLSLNAHGKYNKSLDGGLSVTVTNVTSEDQGIYWCAKKGNYYNRSYKKINFTVRSDFEDLQEQKEMGQDLTLRGLPKKHPGNTFFCKGKDPLACQHLVNPEKFALSVSSERINVTMFNLSADDEGTYWIGAEKDRKHKKEVFYRLELLIGVSVPELDDPGSSSFLVIIVALSVGVGLVLLLVVLVLLKNCKRRNDAPPQNRQEEDIYEEIELPAAGKALNTIYATAGACKESLHYSTFDFGKGGTSSEPRPSTSRCEYSTVFKKSADECTVQAPEPLYCNVNPKKKGKGDVRM